MLVAWRPLIDTEAPDAPSAVSVVIFETVGGAACKGGGGWGGVMSLWPRPSSGRAIRWNMEQLTWEGAARRILLLQGLIITQGGFSDFKC